MEWIHAYDLFLFDFDGLLVNTEELHFEAYREMCRERGFVLEWDLRRFFQAAHFEAKGLQDAIYHEFPKLLLAEPKWEVLYSEKKRAYQRLLEKGNLQLLPGVAPLLEALQKAEIRRCVVTNSLKVQTDLIKKRLPLLQTIPVWVTRECYKEPKPHPESYLKAIDLLGKNGDKMIGFEDSTRGLKALQGAGVKEAVLICPPDHPQMDDFSFDVRCYASFEEMG